MNRLITTKDLQICYHIKSPVTIWNWAKRKTNPLPASLGNCVPKLWHESDLQEWEMANYGRPIISAYLDRRDGIATPAEPQSAQQGNDADHTSASPQGAYGPA